MDVIYRSFDISGHKNKISVLTISKCGRYVATGEQSTG